MPVAFDSCDSRIPVLGCDALSIFFFSSAVLFRDETLSVLGFGLVMGVGLVSAPASLLDNGFLGVKLSIKYDSVLCGIWGISMFSSVVSDETDSLGWSSPSEYCNISHEKVEICKFETEGVIKCVFENCCLSLS